MWGMFIGNLNDNLFHKHYALQISISSTDKLVVNLENEQQFSSSACLITSNIKHQLCCDNQILIILINPISNLGHQLYLKYQKDSIVDLESEFNSIQNAFKSYLEKQIDFEELTSLVQNLLTDLTCECKNDNHFDDDRIYSAIQYLEDNFDRIVSLEEISARYYLSEPRFLHLFKENTNLNFRRYQLWNKLIKSIPYLQTNSITETAHQFGFTDSSHYNRTFKETFGYSPKFLLATN